MPPSNESSGGSGCMTRGWRTVRRRNVLPSLNEPIGANAARRALRAESNGERKQGDERQTGVGGHSGGFEVESWRIWRMKRAGARERKLAVGSWRWLVVGGWLGLWLAREGFDVFCPAGSISASTTIYSVRCSQDSNSWIRTDILFYTHCLRLLSLATFCSEHKCPSVYTTIGKAPGAGQWRDGSLNSYNHPCLKQNQSFKHFVL